MNLLPTFVCLAHCAMPGAELSTIQNWRARLLDVCIQNCPASLLDVCIRNWRASLLDVCIQNCPASLLDVLIFRGLV